MGLMNFQDWVIERQRLLNRIKDLEAENAELRKRLGEDVVPIKQKPTAMQTLSLQEKVNLFRSLFKGREDVFARRWFSKATGKAGYQPVCLNEWGQLCDKRKFKCAEYPNRQFPPLTDNDFYRHLEGKDADGRDVIGLYVLNEDNTCHLICTDFDDKNCEHGYQEDVLAFVDVCKSWSIPCSVERSRSGNGAHVWIFFETPVLAVKAQKAPRRSGRRWNIYNPYPPQSRLSSLLQANMWVRGSTTRVLIPCFWSHLSPGKVLWPNMQVDCIESLMVNRMYKSMITLTSESPFVNPCTESV